MSNLHLEYQDAKTSLVMRPGSLGDFTLSGNRFVWDEYKRVSYRGETYFEGKLRISAAAETRQEKIDNALLESDGGVRRNEYEILIAKGVITVKTPVAKLVNSLVVTVEETIVLPIGSFTDWTLSPLQRLATIRNAREKKSASSYITAAATIYVKGRFAFSDRTPMHIETRFEDFESKQVVSGGRPETNRRKF